MGIWHFGCVIGFWGYPSDELTDFWYIFFLSNLAFGSEILFCWTWFKWTNLCYWVVNIYSLYFGSSLKCCLLKKKGVISCLFFMFEWEYREVYYNGYLAFWMFARFLRMSPWWICWFWNFFGLILRLELKFVLLNMVHWANVCYVNVAVYIAYILLKCCLLKKGIVEES